MAIEVNTQTWDDMKQLLDVTIRELQKWRDYEEEVSYDLDFADMLTVGIDGLMPLMPCVISPETRSF